MPTEKRLTQNEFNALDTESQWFHLLILDQAQGVANQYAHMAKAEHISLSTLFWVPSLMDIKGKTGDYPRYFQVLSQALQHSVRYIAAQPDTAWPLYANCARTTHTVYENGEIYY